MLVFQWNALQVGDRVRVHDDRAIDLALHDGVVALVQTHPHQPNDIGIRLDSDDGAIVHPWRHAVYLGQDDAHEGCWRCETPSGVAA